MQHTPVGMGCAALAAAVVNVIVIIIDRFYIAVQERTLRNSRWRLMKYLREGEDKEEEQEEEQEQELVTWCFTPSRPLRLYQSEEEEQEQEEEEQEQEEEHE